MNAPELKLVELSPATPQLLRDVGALFDELYTHLLANGYPEIVKPSPAADWRKSLEPSLGRGNTLIAACIGAETVGFAQAQLKLMPGYFRSSKAGFIPHLYVKPSARRRGVARALAGEALRWLETHSVDSVELDTIASDQEAQRFWRALGFEVESVKMRRSRPKGS